MADTSAPQPELDPAAPDSSAGTAPAIDQGAYEVIRRRLKGHTDDLRARLGRLNTRRKEVFGTVEFQLQGTDRITTEHNCVPRDILAVGGHFILGFNVHFGLKTQVDLNDVFAVYHFEGGTFHEDDLSLLSDESFTKDFRDLFRFYRSARFLRFFRSGPAVFMVFQVGRDVTDIKAFKWIREENALRYAGNRSDHEVRLPEQQQVQWKRATRDMQTQGAYPHYSIEDKVFVETTGGDLTIKIENSTDTGEGIYAEPVDNPDQSLDDAEIYYVLVGHLVLLRIRPYQENAYRHFIFNTKLQEVVRADGLGRACILLPEDHGLILPGGFYLASGKYQTFPNMPPDLVFDRCITAPNGEDYAYLFYNQVQGVYVLMAYNLIEQTIETPTITNGYAFFGDGQVVFFKAPPDGQPQKHHAVQVWQTPFVSPNHVTTVDTESYLGKIGNREVVRGMAECAQVLELADREALYTDLYVDLVKLTSNLLDAYFWLGHDEAAKLAEPLSAIRAAAQAAVGEYEKVRRIRRSTETQIRAVGTEVEDLVRRNAAQMYDRIEPFVAALAALRVMRGRVIGLRELRYADLARIDALEAQVREQAETLSNRTATFLLAPEALAPYQEAADAHAAKIDALERASEAQGLAEQVQQQADELEMLIEIVGNLQIADTTQRTTIIENISAIFSQLNATRTRLRGRRQELGRREGEAEFGSQMKLLSQSVVNALELCDEPAKTDQYLTRVMLQLEELEGRFAEFDEFTLQLTEKREEIYSAFENRKLQLTERRNRRAEALGQAASRILGSIQARVGAMGAIDQIHSYFASDLMVEKIRDLCADLAALDDSVRVDDIQSRLKTIREDAIRQLKDRLDLQDGGRDTIRFGRHVFSVNTQPMELTTLLRDGRWQLHLAGTQFFETVDDPRFEATRDVWDQDVISEDRAVYRAEYLAFLVFQADDGRLPRIADDEPALLAHVQQFMAPRYSEGYTRGVHDRDAAAYLQALLALHRGIGLLRFPSAARALALLWWQVLGIDAPERQTRWRDRLAGVGAIDAVFRAGSAEAAETESSGPPERRPEAEPYLRELAEQIRAFAGAHPDLDPVPAERAAAYLFCELTELSRREVVAGWQPVVSPEAAALVEAFTGFLRERRAAGRFEASVAALAERPIDRFLLLRDWADALIRQRPEPALDQPYRDELALLLEESLEPGADFGARVHAVSTRRSLTGLLGSHPNLRDGVAQLDYTEFVARLRTFTEVQVPKFEALVSLKHRLVEDARTAMRIEEFRPKVLSSFVRNQLIDRVFLPLIGDNLAKQMGATGPNRRTDRSGLLLLISPPGYGKTTLMEYVASRLGVVFMKINGPAIGHGVTSLDPAEATNAAAREELEKLNLAFEMGDNVMIYVDDIQHTHPEFLQKFISLCDAQRRIEGIYKGRAQTYDFRGRKVAVVMAGNPYTESGEKFRLPDMLTNRADTYNLGDIIGDHGDAFRASYLENCLTSNPALSALATRSQRDVHAVIRVAETGTREGVDFEANYSAEEIEEMVAVMGKLLTVRDVVLRVNQQYIASAGQEDQYRSEPPFLLQGSYRNMNRIAEKVAAVMNEKELRTLIEATYEQDAQTLTTGAEANLLKFREMLGWITATQQARWDEIRQTFQRNNNIRALGGEEQSAAALAQLALMTQGLGAIGASIEKHLSESRATPAAPPIDFAPVAEQLAALRESLAGLQQPAAPAAGAPALPAPPTQEIRVINRIPSTFLFVMKEQFNLMKAWLEPLTRLTADQDDQLKQIVAAIQDLTKRYEGVIGHLEKEDEK